MRDISTLARPINLGAAAGNPMKYESEIHDFSQQKVSLFGHLVIAVTYAQSVDAMVEEGEKGKGLSCSGRTVSQSFSQSDVVDVCTRFR